MNRDTDQADGKSNRANNGARDDATMDGATLPRILLVEDEPVSAAFLRDAIAACPAHVASAETAAEALRLARERPFDLWLIDAHLPDGRGADLLVRLRAEGRDTPALAHTAETAKAVLDALIDAGFEEVLIKPLGVAALQGAIRRFVPSAARAAHASVASVADKNDGDDRADPERPTGGKFPVFDDATALRALNGRREHIAAMRGMWSAELPQQAQRIARALRDDDAAALRAELHKLLASTGFVGALRLQAAARELQAAPSAERARRQFDGAMADTLSALRDQASSE